MQPTKRNISAPDVTSELSGTPGDGADDLGDGYDFGGATFDLNDPGDREILCFILSQALFGEATGVYCGRSLYSARSLEAARFYTRQARQELGRRRGTGLVMPCKPRHDRRVGCPLFEDARRHFAEIEIVRQAGRREP